MRFGETTFRSYSEPLRTLNGDRLLFSPLRGLTVVERSAVLNGILRGSPLNAAALMVPQPDVRLLQRETEEREVGLVLFPEVNPSLLFLGELLHIGLVIGVGDVPGSGFVKVLQLFCVEYVASIGKGKVL